VTVVLVRIPVEVDTATGDVRIASAEGEAPLVVQVAAAIAAVVNEEPDPFRAAFQAHVARRKQRERAHA
jgi:hypothetical protein